MAERLSGACTVSLLGFLLSLVAWHVDQRSAASSTEQAEYHGLSRIKQGAHHKNELEYWTVATGCVRC